MLNSYQEIIESFSSNKYYGITHALETPEEGLCTCYFVELIPIYPQNKDVQFATLWRLMEVQDSKEVYENIDGDELQENLRGYFQYILDEWNTRPITPKDKENAVKIFNECQNSIQRNTTKNGWGTERLSGYYVNGKYKAFNFPNEIKNKILKARDGFVVHDDWNELMMVIEEKNVYSLFYWYTNA